MKSFVITLILFFIILISVPLCSVYASSVISQTEELARAAYENSTSEEALSRLYEYWNSHERFLNLFITFGELDKVTENLIEFKSNAENGNTVLLSQSYELFINSLENIRRFQAPSMQVIF